MFLTIKLCTHTKLNCYQPLLAPRYLPEGQRGLIIVVGIKSQLLENENRFLEIKKYSIPNNRGCPRGVMVKAMDCGIVVREFVLQSRYYVHFRANTLGKGMNPFILPAMG